MKYKKIEIIEGVPVLNSNHTYRVVDKLSTQQSHESDSGGMPGLQAAPTPGGTNIISKMFWQAMVCVIVFTALFALSIAGGERGKKITDTVKSVIGYNIESLGVSDSEVGKIKFTGLFTAGKENLKLPSEISLRPAVKDREFLVLSDRVVYLTNTEDMVYAAAGGIVSQVMRNEHDMVSLKISGLDFDIVYKKLEFCGVKDGDTVAAGDMIGSFSQNGLELFFVTDGVVITGLDNIIQWQD